MWFGRRMKLRYWDSRKRWWWWTWRWSLLLIRIGQLIQRTDFISSLWKWKVKLPDDDHPAASWSSTLWSTSTSLVSNHVLIGRTPVCGNSPSHLLDFSTAGKNLEWCHDCTPLTLLAHWSASVIGPIAPMMMLWLWTLDVWGSQEGIRPTIFVCRNLGYTGNHYNCIIVPELFFRGFVLYQNSPERLLGRNDCNGF